MKIAVLGAGIVGMTTAYELARDGHAVHVYDRHAAAASGDSFAGTGLISPSLINPMTMAHWPGAAYAGPFTGIARIKLRKTPTMDELRWIFAWRRSGKADGFDEAFDHFQRLMAFSQSQMRATATELKLEFERGEGAMLLVPTESVHRSLQAALAHLKELGVTFKDMSLDQARLIEPGLAPSLPAHCAVHFPNDETANCRQFAMLLRTAASRLNVQFHFNSQVQNLQCNPRPALEIAGESERPSFDALVLCTGTDTVRWAPSIQLRLPAASIYGYSVSAAIREPLHAPRSSLVTLDSGLVFTRQGQRVRVSGGAEIGKPGQDHDKKAIQKLFAALHHYFPGSTDLRSGHQNWRGARMFLPDGMPVVGQSPITGIWVNTGHGANGAALASGCARLLADQILGKPALLSTLPLRPDRFAG